MVGIDITSGAIRFTFGIPRGNDGTNGSNGTNGTNGARGSMTFYVDVSPASSWLDATANTASAAYPVKQIGDTVTQYNQTAAYAETKFWDGTTWNPLGSGLNSVSDGLTTFNGALIAGGQFDQHGIEAGGHFPAYGCNGLNHSRSVTS